MTSILSIFLQFLDKHLGYWLSSRYSLFVSKARRIIPAALHLI
jgi:hypothetical protein